MRKKILTQDISRPMLSKSAQSVLEVRSPSVYPVAFLRVSSVRSRNGCRTYTQIILGMLPLCVPRSYQCNALGTLSECSTHKLAERSSRALPVCIPGSVFARFTSAFLGLSQSICWVRTRSVPRTYFDFLVPTG